MSKWILVLALIAGFFMVGCIQPQAASRCDSYSPGAQKDTCLQYMATWYQDPYSCYGISDMSVRKDCLQAAVDPMAAKKLYAGAKTQERQLTVRQTNDSITPPEQAPPVVQEQPAAGSDSRVAKCLQEKQNASADACAYQTALDYADISLCNTIQTEEYRQPCVTNIALTKKDPSICGQLEAQADAQMCKFYSSG